MSALFLLETDPFLAITSIHLIYIIRIALRMGMFLFLIELKNVALSGLVA